MPHRIGRPLPHPFALACALALGACSSPAPRTPPALAATWEREAADGRFESAFSAAGYFEVRNDPRALDLYTRAAAAQPWTFNNTRAEAALGRIWSEGTLRHGTAPDVVTAPPIRASWRRGERWYLAAARHGNPYAFADLAQAYRQRGDAAQALRWDLRQMVYKRLPSRASGLPAALTTQDGTPHAQVVKLQQRAARGDADAQVDLGAVLERGVGLPRDPARALQLYQQAGEHGNVFGQYFAGLLLGRGAPGVPRDRDAAAVWFARAEAQRFYMAAPSYWHSAVAPPMFNFSQ